MTRRTLVRESNVSLNETSRSVSISRWWYLFPFLFFFSFRRQVTNSSRREQCNIRGAEVRGRSRGTMHPSGVKGDRRGGGEGSGETERESRTYPGPYRRVHIRRAAGETDREKARGTRGKKNARFPGSRLDSRSDSQLCGSGPWNSRLHATYPARNTDRAFNCKSLPVYEVLSPSPDRSPVRFGSRAELGELMVKKDWSKNQDSWRWSCVSRTSSR